jgi:large subunit ribosomal protein L6
MSRIGKQPITIPNEVTITKDGSLITVKGPKGELSFTVPAKIAVDIKDNVLTVTRLTEDKPTRSNHGTVRACINNMIQGVTQHFKKELEIRGTGYKAQVNGNKLKINAGYIHPVEITAPEGIFFEVQDENKITVTGCDKVVVGQVASNIRKIRKPEPYKGKGIRYLNEFIKIKAGKKAKA